MRKWLLLLFVLLLAACNTDTAKEDTPSDNVSLSVSEANNIATEVINDIWATLAMDELSEVNEVTLKENEASFLPFMTEDVFLRVLEDIDEGSCVVNCIPAFPEQIDYVLDVQLIESSANSFTIEHVLSAIFEDESAKKQTTTFIKQDDRYIVSDFKIEPTTVSVTKEQAEELLTALGFEVTFIEEGPFEASNISLAYAYVFEDKEDSRIQMVVGKDNGYYTWVTKDDEAADGDAPIYNENYFAPYEEIDQKYAYLFTYNLMDIDESQLTPELQQIYNTYITDVIGQTIDIDFDESLSSEERQIKIAQVLDAAVDGLIAEIEKHVDATTFAELEVNHEIWLADRYQYTKEWAHAFGTYDEEQFYRAYKNVTEDYLAKLFYEYFY
ncbi:MAG: hypothetical protein ACI33M_00895 [Lysinibacillus sp.]